MFWDGRGMILFFESFEGVGDNGWNEESHSCPVIYLCCVTDSTVFNPARFSLAKKSLYNHVAPPSHPIQDSNRARKFDLVRDPHPPGSKQDEENDRWRVREG
jgi:hypothetical protein